VLSAWSGRADTPILPPDAAARLYGAGRTAVQKGQFADGAEKLRQALATGHTTPQERYGTTRYSVERYDPYYWLGVAYMELGDEAKARENLLRSKDAGLIRGWPEFSDLSQRLLALDRKPIPTFPIPTATPPLPTPSPTTLPFELTPVPSRPPEPSATPTPLPASAPDLDAVLAAIGAADWRTAERRLKTLQEQDPSSANLLSALVFGTRYVLDGRRDEALLVKARTGLAAFRKAGGSRSVEERWLSPSLRRLLG